MERRECATKKMVTCLESLEVESEPCHWHRIKIYKQTKVIQTNHFEILISQHKKMS